MNSEVKVTALPCGGVELFIPYPPTPASRPRVTSHGTYFTGSYRDYRKALELAIPPAPAPLEGNLTVNVTFDCVKPKTTKRLNPRGDIDNHVKAIFDAITKAGYWVDDDQITQLYATKQWADPTPATTITITHNED